MKLLATYIVFIIASAVFDACFGNCSLRGGCAGFAVGVFHLLSFVLKILLGVACVYKFAQLCGEDKPLVYTTTSRDVTVSALGAIAGGIESSLALCYVRDNQRALMLGFAASDFTIMTVALVNLVVVALWRNRTVTPV